MRAYVLLPLALAAVPGAALANDSAAAVGLGGIELRQNGAVSMDYEDLYISKDEVRVTYRFTNRSARAVETVVSFPVPVLSPDSGMFEGDIAVPDYRALDFRTTVDGRPVKLGVTEQALLRGRDVTARVRALGWPVNWITKESQMPDFVVRLSPQQRAAYRKEGLLKPAFAGSSDIIPAWDVVTHITRTQTFLPGKTVEVSHRYKPLNGGSVAGALEPEYRGTDKWHRSTYCIDTDFYAAYDRRQAAERKTPPDNPAYASETWISYILSSGRNWKGPIGEFRLVVDKGKPDNLVSFCMNGVKKISPTQFEVRKTRFEPKGNLEILIAEWYRPE